MKTKIFLVAIAAGLLCGCAQQEVRNIDTVNDDNAKAVMSLDYRDFDLAASQMVQSMLSSNVLTKPDGGRYVMTTGRIVNDTMQRIDTAQLMAKIEEELMNSGQVAMTSAVGGKIDDTDEMIYELREGVRDTDMGEEFEQETLAAKGTLVAPELSISGKIFQRNLRYTSKTQQVEYYFQLKITDLTSGLRFWQKETLIGKRGSNKSVSW